VIGAILSQEDAEQVFDLTGADAHGECGDRQASASGLVEGEGRRGDGNFGRRRLGSRGLQALLDLSGVVVDGLSAATRLLGPTGDGAVDAGEDGSSVADDGADR
jgi:hypothetical protein